MSQPRVIAAQGKRYFEELFHLGTSVLRDQRAAGEASETDPAQADDEG